LVGCHFSSHWSAAKTNKIFASKRTQILVENQVTSRQSDFFLDRVGIDLFSPSKGTQGTPLTTMEGSLKDAGDFIGVNKLQSSLSCENRCCTGRCRWAVDCTSCA